MSYYNRYTTLTSQGEVEFHPDIKLAEKETDKFIVYEVGKTRFDKLSEEKYGEPYWGFLILLANPELQGLEFLIPNQTVIRIPFPLDITLRELKNKVDEKIRFYGD